MNEKLCELARQAKKGAYSPYSRFCVGAALLCKDGSIYQGCNIENSAFTPTVCAERVAFFKAVSEGKREFDTIAIAADRDYTSPCGVCRQVMSEFCTPDFKILLVSETDYREYTLGQLLPLSFEL